MWNTVKNRLHLITGPCSAESEEQVHTIARQLSEKGLVDTFRAGVWKPRTRPGTFEGVGEVALSWLADVQRDYKLRASIEVANASHVELALKYGINNFWIGARTTVNPFYVQEIADALANTNSTVLVKNPIHPDAELWSGGIERIQKSCGEKVGAIHRGFSSFQTSQYRNIPRWEIPIELKRRFPDLFLVCDISHIAGKRSLLHEVAQKAIDLGITGLMIETHPNPTAALSDANQQITVEGLQHIIDTLVQKTSGITDATFLNQLEELRAQIDKIDEDILNAISSRLNLTKEIGTYKKENNVTVFQLNRWNEILETRGENGKKLNLDNAFVHKLYETIHAESIRLQTEVVEQKLPR